MTYVRIYAIYIQKTSLLTKKNNTSEYNVHIVQYYYSKSTYTSQFNKHFLPTPNNAPEFSCPGGVWSGGSVSQERWYQPNTLGSVDVWRIFGPFLENIRGTKNMLHPNRFFQQSTICGYLRGASASKYRLLDQSCETISQHSGFETSGRCL